MLVPLAAVLTIVAPSAGSGLEWSAPAGCPTAEDVDAGVGRLLAVGAADRKPAQGAIEPTQGGFALTVTVEGISREVTARECEPLGAVAALIIAVAHDPLSVADTIEKEVVVAPAPVPVAVSEPSLVPDAPASSPNKTYGAVRPFVGFGGGVLPGIGVGFGLAVAVLGERWWRVEVSGSGWLPRRGEVEVAPQFGADIVYAGGSIRACAVPSLPRLSFPLCLGPELGALIANGRGPGLTSLRSTQLFVSADVSAGIVVRIRRYIGLAARAELLVGLRRPGVHVQGQGFVHRALPAGGRLLLGPELRFP